MMNTRCRSWTHVAAVLVITFAIATFGWSQSDSSTTVSNPTPKPSPSRTKKSNTAKFDKPNTDDAQSNTDVAKRLNSSASVLDEIMGTPDKAIPTNVLADAKCIAVVPSMVHIAVGFGGRHGKGVATCRTTKGWSAPAPITITGGSWGLQLGGEATDLVMLVMNQKGMDHLLSSKFKIGAEVTGAAGPVGRQAAAGTDWKMRAEILTYSRSRGLFAGINLNGTAIKQDKDETALLYGKFVPFQSLLSGKVRTPADAETFLSTVQKYSNVAAENKQGD
jgi:lipid-binding SYLF domain-containing protein